MKRLGTSPSRSRRPTPKTGHPPRGHEEVRARLPARPGGEARRRWSSSTSTPSAAFPEEFLPFLGLSGEPREAFLARHAELLGVAFWTAMQEEHRAGRVPDIFPYPRERRFEAQDAPPT
jgi:isocitrate dehydrogenase kinase/phosphatase